MERLNTPRVTWPSSLERAFQDTVYAACSSCWRPMIIEVSSSGSTWLSPRSTRSPLAFSTCTSEKPASSGSVNQS